MKLRLSLLALVGLLAACQAAPPVTPTLQLDAAPRRSLLLATAAAVPEVKSKLADRSDLALTVYQDNVGLINDARRVALPQGRVLLRLEDVSPQMDGTSAVFRAPGGGVRLAEQQFVSVPLNPASLLERYVGKEVEVRIPAEGDRPSQVVKATLISAEGPVVQIDGKVYLQPPGQVIVPEVPKDLATHPSLLWTLDVTAAGTHELVATYLTGGLGWSADYQLTLAAEGGQADWRGWVTLRNTSGLTYPDARLTVVAGNRGTVRPPVVPLPFEAAKGAAAPGTGGDSAFTESPLFEYHRYDLEERATLEAGQTRQLGLMSAAAMPVTRTYILDSGRFYGPPDQEQGVEVMLGFDNTEANRLGKPLPKGVVRIYQPDADNTLRLLGEDSLPETAVDGKVKLKAGKAFDLVGKRRQTANRQISEHVREEAYEVVLRNEKKEAVTVEVVEHPYGDWKLTAQSMPHTARSANEVVFAVPVPAGGTASLTFTFQITTGR